MTDDTNELIPEMTARQAADLLAQGADVLLLDVREPFELRYAHLDDPHVHYAPLSQLANQGLAALPDELRQRQEPVIVFCHLGFRSAQVTYWLRQVGFQQVYNLAGGIDAYAREVDPGIGRY